MINSPQNNFNSLWAIEPNALNKLAAMPHADLLSPGDTSDLETEVVNGIAVIPLVGVMGKSESWYADVGTIDVLAAVEQFANDATVKGIMLLIDSPGGEVAGTQELADAVAACPKPIVAVISDMGCSAAYWVASQCDAIIANETALVGSIGVYGLIPDTSEMYAKLGVKMNMIKAGDMKGVGAPGVPVSAAQLASQQTQVNDMYDIFTTSVGNSRGIKSSISEWGNGDAFLSSRAKGLGLIDGIGSIAEVLSFMGTKSMSKTNLSKQIKAVAEITEAVVAATKVEEIKAEPVAVAVAPEIKVEAKVEALSVADQIAAAKAETILSEKARFAAILSACGGREVLATKEFIAGHDANQARETYTANLESEKTQLEKQLKTAQASTSDGANFVSVISALSTSASPEDFEAEWVANENGLQARFGGSKKNFLSTRKREQKNKENN